MKTLSLVVALLAALGAALAANAPGFYATPFEKRPTSAALTRLGRNLFFDPSLSASGKLSCAACHDPAHAFSPANDAPIQRGGRETGSFGVRAVPSLTYTQNVPAFTEHYVEDEGDDSIDQGPAGGRTWDGRASSAHDQARLPLLSANEMANESPEALVATLRRGPLAAQFKDTFGEHVLADSTLLFKGALLALETYQQTPQEFYPYTSKYDAWLRHQATLSDSEQRGLVLFNDPNKGNCARCHPSSLRHGAFPQFTDFGFIALGAPRNLKIPANLDPHYFDLGLCGPLRTDLAEKTQYCGMFRTPSLRNVALRRVFLHNGVFHDLREVVRFYATRDSEPQRWYPKGPEGRIAVFNDLPEAYRANVDREAPFGRHPGDPPAFSDQETEDIVAFLNTLTDGFKPSAPAL